MHHRSPLGGGFSIGCGLTLPERMSSDRPLQISRTFLTAMGMRMYVYHENRIPQDSALVVVSNHRSFMDAPVLMAAVKRPIRFACHHYMSQVPVMRDIVTQLGCFPLEAQEQRQQSFFTQAIRLLLSQQVVGVFPEGAKPMVSLTQHDEIGDFQRGFAHLAMRAPVRDLAILPVAIASREETINSAVPLRLLSFFDPSEPLFERAGWHPMVLYSRANVLIGRPCWITQSQRKQYQGKGAKMVVADLTHYCKNEIASLLRQGCL